MDTRGGEISVQSPTFDEYYIEDHKDLQIKIEDDPVALNSAHKRSVSKSTLAEDVKHGHKHHRCFIYKDSKIRQPKLSSARSDSTRRKCRTNGIRNWYKPHASKRSRVGNAVQDCAPDMDQRKENDDASVPPANGEGPKK